MKTKLFLGFMALMFIPYGLYCLVDPSVLAGGAGVMATSMTGTIELQTMYGGLQTSIGVMCLLAVFQPRFQPGALMALVFIFAGLAIVRVSLGLAHGEFSGYNVFAMSFEAVALVLAILLQKSAQQVGDGVLNS